MECQDEARPVHLLSKRPEKAFEVPGVETCAESLDVLHDENELSIQDVQEGGESSERLQRVCGGLGAEESGQSPRWLGRYEALVSEWHMAKGQGVDVIVERTNDLFQREAGDVLWSGNCPGIKIDVNYFPHTLIHFLTGEVENAGFTGAEATEKGQGSSIRSNVTGNAFGNAVMIEQIPFIRRQRTFPGVDPLLDVLP